MKRYILLFLLGLGLSAFVPSQAKADEDFSIGPVTVYRHHSPEWYRERERLRRREWREHQWREHSGENITGAIILIKISKLETLMFSATCLPTRQIARLLAVTSE